VIKFHQIPASGVEVAFTRKIVWMSTLIARPHFMEEAKQLQRLISF